MSRWRYAAIFLLTFGLVLILTSPAQADHQQILPGTPTKVMNKAIDRGYVTYRLDANASAYPNFRTQANAVSLAGLIGVGIEAVEIFSGTPDIWLTMPSDDAFISTCGSGAAGCILYTLDPVIIYFRRALLYNSWLTTISHEGLNYGHTMGQHEQYYDNGRFECNTQARYTVMSCGTGVWEPQPYDIQVVHSLTRPKPLSSFYGIGEWDGRLNGYWCGGDTLRGRRVAIMAIAPDKTVYWSGIHRNITSGCDSIPIIGEPGWCYSVSSENGWNFKRGEFRVESEIGCL